MFVNLWNEKDFRGCVRDFIHSGVKPDLAERVYSSRLIGTVPDLVMHGGGNTSCKTSIQDIYGELVDILHVKGSGWDLATIEPEGMPGLRLNPLLELRKLSSLTDKDMTNILRLNLIDCSSPNPSVETLLHAFLPFKIVDHTHATPFLSLLNLPEAEKFILEIFEGKLGVVPYVMPGFELAKLASEVYESNKEVEGLALLKHGHFTWGESAQNSYERIINQTNQVEKWLKKRREKNSVSFQVPSQIERVKFFNDLQGALREVCTRDNQNFIFDLIDKVEMIGQVNSLIPTEISLRGLATPDHVIRLKPRPLTLRKVDYAKGIDSIKIEIEKFISFYKHYFKTNCRKASEHKVMLDPMPKFAWVEDIGIVGIGSSKKEATIITDLAIQNLKVISDSELNGGFHPVNEKHLFDLEYWSLEQAKLGSKQTHPLVGKVVLITGAAGAIGRAITGNFERIGSEVIAVDKDAHALNSASKGFSKDTRCLASDITKDRDVEKLFDIVHRDYGGIDILISNAGTAPQASILDTSLKSLKSSFEINFFAHFRLAKLFAEVCIAQNRKGQMLFNVSKQAVNPGKNFGAYGLPKATLFFLIRQLALEFGEFGIRVNGINADRIRSGIVTKKFIKERASQRAVTEEEYMRSNLLKTEVKAEHVADAFVSLALSEGTTGHVMTVDGGNIEASLR